MGMRFLRKNRRNNKTRLETDSYKAAKYKNT